MAINTAAKRASALATRSQPYLRLVLPDGSVDRSVALGLYPLTTSAPPTSDSPTDIRLSRRSVYTTAGVNALVGFISVVDADVGETHTLSLAAGGADNALFTISGNQLLCLDPAAAGAGAKSILLEADDGISTPYQEAFTINVVVPSLSQGRSSKYSFSFGLGIH